MFYGSQSIDLERLPTVYGTPVFCGTYRAKASDFKVVEDLGFEPCGEGSHIWVLIQKTYVSTDEAAMRLAAVAGVSRKDLGYAGKKDTFAQTIQWMSLPETASVSEGPIDASVKVLKLKRNLRKLKIGQLAGNYFRLRLVGEIFDGFEARIKAISRYGVPNYFGLQRFGRLGSNLNNARRLAGRDPEGKRRLHPKQGMSASAARSAGFNAVVARRILDAGFLNVRVNDSVILSGSGSHFSVREADLTAVRERIISGELSPTGPMAGRRQKSFGEQALKETAVLATDVELYSWMHGVFKDEERRSVRALPKQLEAKVSGNTLELRFWLPKGCFATALLNELGNITEAYARTSS